MSKPVKQMMRKDLAGRLEGVGSLAVVDFTGTDAVTTNRIRGRLREKDIRMAVVRNAIARQAFREVGLDVACAMLDGPCALAYGADSVVTVVRELLELGKEAPNLTVKGALMEGEVFEAERIEALSKYPTREEAIARVLAAAVGPASRLAGCLRGPGDQLASALKTIEQRAGGAGAEPGDG